MGKVYAFLWIGWVMAFLAIELSAIFTGHSVYTLSDFVWKLERLGTTWTSLRFFIAAFAIWLFLHMTFGLFR